MKVVKVKAAVVVLTLMLCGAYAGVAGNVVFAQPTSQPTSVPTKTTSTAAPSTKAPVVSGKVVLTDQKDAADKEVIDQKEDTQKWWQNLLVTVISTVLTIATPVLSLLLVILLRRWNIKVELDKVQHFAKAGKDYAEQFARNKLKEGKKLAAPEVAKIALDKGRELSEGKLAPWAADKLSDWIEAKVGSDNKDKPVNGVVA